MESNISVQKLQLVSKMNKIEVNPRLFITCRLCLEDLGVYQIVPAVKEQILYCFDINVEPFDGLPQLICKKCESILSNYSEIKKKIINKQNDLKNKLVASHNGALPKTEPEKADTVEHIEFRSNNQNLNVSKKRIRCISSSSSDYEPSRSMQENEEEKEKKTGSSTHNKISLLWPSDYTKKYVCRICNSRYLNTKKLKSHVNSRHTALKKKYSNIFKRHCEVKLIKIDDKLNITGSRNKVMHTRDKIIENANPKYYVIYTANDSNDDARYANTHEVDAWKLNTKNTVIRKGYVNSDSSNDEIIVKRKRTKRLYSRSSNETVVLDTEHKSNISDDDDDKKFRSSRIVQRPVELDECINIADSSDSESDGNDASKTKSKEIYTFKTKKEDLIPDDATINNIINNCQNKYIKKHYNDNYMMKPNKNPTEIATQLRRKILSIGQKLINKKKDINCTPLLRFLEHKNLDIVWHSLTITDVNQGSNYIRIIARMKKNVEKNVDNETGWTDYNYTPISNLNYEQIIGVASHTSKRDKVAEVSTMEPDKVANGIDTSEVPSTNIPEIAVTDSAVLIADTNLNGTDTKKLLNANPVANPKQLPKKSTANEMKTVKNIAAKQNASNVEVPSVEDNDTEPEFCMPIITSTTSLAVPFSILQNNDVPTNQSEANNTKYDNQKTEAPRIKVKPPSELMSVETLNRMKGPTQMPCIVSSTSLTAQNENNFINLYVPPMTTISHYQNNLQPNDNISVSFSPEPSWKNDYMILDTTELPNTKTNSPFQYFRRLLQLHNITLLDTDVELSKEFNCLIKFKVLYKQETNNQPVILCLALFCSKNVFCLKIKDRNQENINISRISPNWQWEVLKIYKGEVVNKLLNNAQKVSQEVYEFTNSFLCLLKSINLIKS